MNRQEIVELLKSLFDGNMIQEVNPAFAQPQLLVATESISLVCEALQKNPLTYFDFLSCLTALDNGPAANTLEVIYNLYSLPFEHSITLKVVIPRKVEGNDAYVPEIPTVSNVYKSALWHEREAFDFFGIVFTNHPDLRRIFLPEDWKGYPLRKDYTQEEYYHGIKIEY